MADVFGLGEGIRLFCVDPYKHHKYLIPIRDRNRKYVCYQCAIWERYLVAIPHDPEAALQLEACGLLLNCCEDCTYPLFLGTITITDQKSEMCFDEVRGEGEAAELERLIVRAFAHEALQAVAKYLLSANPSVRLAHRNVGIVDLGTVKGLITRYRALYMHGDNKIAI